MAGAAKRREVRLEKGRERVIRGRVDPSDDFGFHSKCFGKTLEGFKLGSDMSIFTYKKLTLAAL